MPAEGKEKKACIGLTCTKSKRTPVGYHEENELRTWLTETWRKRSLSSLLLSCSFLFYVASFLLQYFLHNFAVRSKMAQ